MINYPLLEKAYSFVAQHAEKDVNYKYALVCGSGWSDVADLFDIHSVIPYEKIPGFGGATISGHPGKLIMGRLAGKHTLIFQGRRHYYEGEGWTPLVLPVYLCKRLAIESLLLTNAAGSLDKDMGPGSIMMLTDHINNMGVNPLIGKHQEVWGPRFPDQSKVYHEPLREKLLLAAKQNDVPLFAGTYLANTGPCYETPAEIQAYQTWGVQAVGMSTVPEAQLANAAGMKVAALSCISNYAAGIIDKPLDHKEVLETLNRSMEDIKNVIKAYWEII